MNEQQTVLVVDDEAKIVDAVTAYLERSGFTALCAVNGKEAQKILTQNAVSLVLLDLMLPDLPGEEICRRIRGGFYDAIDRGVPIIMITAKADEISVIRGLNMGADDYITKPFSPRELVARITAILRRSGRIKSSAPVVIGDVVIDRENREVKRNGETISLTANEYLLLELLASSPRKIFTRDEIINGIKSGDFDGFDRAVDSHIKNLRRKLGDAPKARRYIETVYGMGYRAASNTRGAV
ncbi:MAG: DNA-binding response regulator [Treponematales bacterium]